MITYREAQLKLMAFKEQGLTQVACNGTFDELLDELLRIEFASLETGDEPIDPDGDEPPISGSPVRRSPKPSPSHGGIAGFVKKVRTNRHPAIIPAVAVPFFGGQLTQIVDRGVFVL